VTGLRCFKARTAGIDITSKKASITGVLVAGVALVPIHFLLEG
jgi:hypothetical protein